MLIRVVNSTQFFILVTLGVSTGWFLIEKWGFACGAISMLLKPFFYLIFKLLIYTTQCPVWILHGILFLKVTFITRDSCRDVQRKLMNWEEMFTKWYYFSHSKRFMVQYLLRNKCIFSTLKIAISFRSFTVRPLLIRDCEFQQCIPFVPLFFVLHIISTLPRRVEGNTFKYTRQSTIRNNYRYTCRYVSLWLNNCRGILARYNTQEMLKTVISSRAFITHFKMNANI